jgi:hypothetical protein
LKMLLPALLLMLPKYIFLSMRPGRVSAESKASGF